MLLKAVVLAVMLHQPHHGVGTRFAPPSIDASNKGADKHMACLVHDRPNREAVRLLWRGAVVAHKSLPCMTEIVLCVDRTQLCERAVVGDRGPVHADIDVYHKLSQRLRHNGKEAVTWYVIRSLSAKTEGKRQ
jgi:hypothetical protein